MNVAEIGELRKKLTSTIAENAQLTQKCQLLEIKLKEAEERNCNIQKMNGTIMNVLTDFNRQEEQAAAKQATQVKVNQLEQTNKTLKSQLQESQYTIQQLTQRIQQLQNDSNLSLKQIGSLETEVKQLNQQLSDWKIQNCSIQNQLEEQEFECSKQRFSQDVLIEELTDENARLKEELKSLMAQCLRRQSSQLSSIPSSPKKTLPPTPSNKQPSVRPTPKKTIWRK